MSVTRRKFLSFLAVSPVAFAFSTNTHEVPRLRRKIVTTGMKFLEDCIESVRKNTLDDFRFQYFNCPVLVIEDAHYIRRGNFARNEFYYILKYRNQHGLRTTVI